MLDLYTWSTPNGRKVSITLEEMELEYRVHSIDIRKGDQHTQQFLNMNLNGKIPVLVDDDRVLMESGAILLYLADKTGQLAGTDPWVTLQWLMFQMGGVGPQLGQAHHFHHYNPGRSEYAEARYLTEAKRLYGVLDARLKEGEYLAGNYSIADIANWAWISRFAWHEIDWADYPDLRRWYGDIAARDAVKRGFDVPEEGAKVPLPN